MSGKFKCLDQILCNQSVSGGNWVIRGLIGAKKAICLIFVITAMW